LKITGGAGLALTAFGSAAPTSSAPALATRVLGRTEQTVTILGLGTAPIGEGPVELQEGIRIFGEVLDRGVTYVDTANIYGNAEEILGHLIPTRRDNLFVATKVSTHSAARADRSLSESLRRFGNDLTDDLAQGVVGVVKSKASQPLREAAAQALAAMNLPSQKISSLLVETAGGD